MPRTQLSTSFLAEVAEGFAASPLWRRYARHDRIDRTSTRLVHTPVYEVWLLGWSPGQGVDLHDHGLSDAAFAVVEGELVEVTVERASLTRRTFESGGVREVPAGTVHDVLNLSGEVATSIHVYSPVLETMSFYDPVTYARTRTEDVTSDGALWTGALASRIVHPAAARRR
jgi:quercetin dioxygenase-like cupin family protein